MASHKRTPQSVLDAPAPTVTVTHIVAGPTRAERRGKLKVTPPLEGSGPMVDGPTRAERRGKLKGRKVLPLQNKPYRKP